MCITVGPGSTARRGPLGRLWWQIASHPLRLLGTTAAFQLVLFSLLFVLPHATAPLLALTGLGIAALLLFGGTFSALSHWSLLSPVHYMRYSSCALALNLGLFLLLLASANLPLLLPFGAAVLMSGQLLGMRAVHRHAPWIRDRYRGQARVAMVGSYVVAVGMVMAMLHL